jgi:hypothetical protein
MNNAKNPTPSLTDESPIAKLSTQIREVSDLEIVDITPEEIYKRSKLHDGADKAMATIERLTPAEIARAGINEKEVTRAIGLIAEYRRFEDALPAAEKLVELLHENKLDRGHQISLLLGEIATQARRRGERDPNGAEILGPLADLFEYQYGPAKKGVATRAKKAKAARAMAESGPPQSTPTP